MTDKSNVNSMNLQLYDKTVNINFVEYQYIALQKKHYFEFCWTSLADEHNTLPKLTRRNVKLNKFAFGTQWMYCILLCKHHSVWRVSGHHVGQMLSLMRSSFLFVLLSYFILSSRVLLLNFKHSGSCIHLDCFGDSTRSMEPNFLSVTGCTTWVRHLGIHVKRFSAIKITYYPNSVATFNLARLASSGDIGLNPGPDCKVPSTTMKKSAWKFPYAICEKPARCNQKGIQCRRCDRWHHIKCIDMDLKTYVALSHSQDRWLCSGNSCGLPFDFSASVFDSSFFLDTTESNDGSHDDSRGIYTLRELVEMIRKLKTHIIFISKTKIDSTYPDNQFTIPGYTLYRNNRKKGGGGILVYVSMLLPCKRLRINRTFKTLEPLAVDVRVGTTDMTVSSSQTGVR